MKSFWLGFENPENRLRDERGNEMILKLKDWPTSEDFEKIMPSRFEEFMTNLPVRNYTHRNGQSNLISYVPDFFLKPDLGPKLYIAYSSAQIKNEGTTNLHVDISDAVNVLLYVGKLKQTYETGQHDDELLQLLIESNVCQAQLERYLSGETPGALWHLFKPEDADKIRTFISLVCFFFLLKSNLQPNKNRLRSILIKSRTI
jgi:lysine-specific demethylase 3